MKNYLKLLALSIIIISCDGGVKTSNKINVKLLNDRLKLINLESLEILKSSTIFSAFDHELSNYVYKIDDIIKKLGDLSEFKTGEEMIDFTKEYNFFKQEKYFKIDFWKTSKLNVEETLFIVEKLLFELRKCELSNAYFKFENIELKFEKSKDGKRLNYSFCGLQEFKSTYFIGDKSQCNNKKYVDKHVVIGEMGNYIDISAIKGNLIEGGIYVQKDLSPVFIPFSYKLK